MMAAQREGNSVIPSWPAWMDAKLMLEIQRRDRVKPKARKAANCNVCGGKRLVDGKGVGQRDAEL
jgi:hypothetical protein